MKVRALQFGTFTLSGGKLSSYYVDLRVVPSFPDAFIKTVTAYVEILKNEVGLENVDAIGGIPTAGLAYAGSASYVVEKPMIYVRGDVKAHGTSRRIEGALTPGWRVVVLDDVITTGSSISKAVDAIRMEGGVVEKAIVLIDRLEGGVDIMAKNGVKVYSLTNISEVADTLHFAGVIDDDQKHAIDQQVRGQLGSPFVTLHPENKDQRPLVADQ